MTEVSRAEAKDMYSWWWDSHISPKNSKWLQENLTDMDSKVRIMIELIEVDEDTFARRAEMYYKKRPELMKLVEEFYRAYRALAERYDHATGVIRQAHRTMADVFPNQVSLLLTDDVPVFNDFDPQTPEIQPPFRASFDPDELVNGEMGRKGPKQSNGLVKARKGLNFQELGDKSQTRDRVLSESERLGQSETDIQALKEAIAELETEKEAGLSQYHQTIERLCKLETEVSRASKAEAQVQSLKETLTKVEAEREASLLQYQQCLGRISNLESHISSAEQNSGKETELLREELTGFKAEKDAILSKYLGALEKIANLENKLLLAEDYANRTSDRAVRAEKEVESLTETVIRLSVENEAVVFKYEECMENITLTQVENERLKTEVGIQSRELSDKQKEMGRLWRSVQEERMRFMEAETSFGLLRNLHSKVQEELRSVANEFQKKVQLLKEMEIENLHLVDEVQMIKEENSKLNEKNELLENLLSDLRIELEQTREKMKALEESLEVLTRENSVVSAEKTSIISQLQITTKNLENVAERNTYLEISLSDANAELEMLREKSKNLEDSCRLLNDQNSVLVLEKQTLASQMESTQQRLKDLGKRHVDLETRYSSLEVERESTLQKVEELQFCLDIEKQEHVSFRQMSQIQMDEMENQIRTLQEVGDYMRDEFEEELDKAINSQFEIFILGNSVQDLKNENTSLLVYCEKLTEASDFSEKLVLELEHKCNEQQEEVRVASSQIRGLRSGMFQLLDALETNVGLHDDQRILSHILGRIGDIKGSFSRLLNENEELVIEKSVLVEVLGQLKQDVGELNDAIVILREEISPKNDQILILQKEMQKLLENNEELILKVRASNQREAVLLNEMENLRKKLFDLQEAYEDLREENTNVVKDKEYLMKAVKDHEDEKHNLEHECSYIVGELRKNIDKLCSDNRNLEVLLKKAENELEEVRVVNNRLKDEIDTAEETLWLKEMKLLEAEAIKVQQENKIFELSDNYAQQMEECEDLRNVRHNLNSQISELQKGKDEVKLWETVSGAFFAELQSCSVREALIKEKFSELMRAYKTLEEESYSKGVDIAQLRERVGVLENENCEVKARLAVELSAISSLRDSVDSLEKHTIWHAKLIRTDNEEKEDAENCQSFSNDDLRNLQSRIQAVEKSVIELKQRTQEEYSTLRSDLESATRQVEVLKSQNSLRRGSSGRFSRRISPQSQEDLKHLPSTTGRKPQKTSLDVSEPMDGLRMKDIMLDQVSDCSSGKNRRITGSDDHILELWQTMDQGGSIDLTVGKPYRLNAVVPNKFRENKSGRPSSESMVEKEVGVDEQENSNRFLSAHQEDTRRKVLQKLASDVQKLTNLQITVQDLKEKLELTENSSNKEKGVFQCDGIKDQLGETEETILKLFDYSAKLMKKVEKSSPPSNSTADSSDSGSARRRRYSEQARRISEKIGRLQMDVQKIQFHLMKLDSSNNKLGNKSVGTRVTERNTRILLRDYLYGVSRTPRRRKKTRFCGCVQPPTKGD